MKSRKGGLASSIRSAPTRSASREAYRLIKKQRFVSVKGLSEVLGVSEMTVRRDLRLLEKKGLVRRIFGELSLLSLRWL